MKILDLREVASRRLEPLFEEEAQLWIDELLWDYRASQQLIRKFIDARSLGGYMALVDDEPAGYGFYIVEEQKGLIGGLYVSPRCAEPAVAPALLEEIAATLRGTPRLRRIEAQLITFGPSYDAALEAERFRLHTRNFMVLRLGDAPSNAAPVSAGLRLERWDDRHFEACARLIQLAYANHVDSEINDQYRTEAGALRFLKNIIILPGCGRFLPEASFVIKPAAENYLVGAVLNSNVSAGVAHTTQICVMPGYQRHGLGLRLLSASVQALRSLRYHALSLSVTAANTRAVTLYEKFGFKLLKTFPAAVWQE
jgi:ribosomal protein S18 acetylase RimI-like enzyme